LGSGDVTNVIVRPATLADAPAIAAIHCSDIVAWKRWDTNDEPRIVHYEDLTTYERWLNGGPWMDVTTLAPHLERLLQNDGIALVAEEDGCVLAEAEASVSDEPSPLGRYLNIEVIYTLRGHAGHGLGSALMQELFAIARREQCAAVIVSHTEAPAFYAKHGLAPFQTWRRARLPAALNQTQYSAEAFGDADYATVRGWAMPIGRHQSARHEWERLRPGAEPDFAEWRGLRLERWRLTVRHHPAMLILDESPRRPGAANVHLWLPPGQAPSRQLLAALRDRAARSGFIHLACFMEATQLAALGNEQTDDAYEQSVWLKTL
jgi:GNAT superfamily N-acetyltransferase